MNRTLIIVDMQDYFVDRNERRIIPAVLKLIQYAKSNGWGIIVLEFDGCGKTIKEIAEKIKKYEHLVNILKYSEDGGEEILHFTNNNPRWSKDFVICGVYGDMCVAGTVWGLLDRSNAANVTVIKNATSPPYNDEYGGHTRQNIITLKELMQQKCLV